ncbi:hypothetical protein ABAC460_14865 [Asticcacaulis sp. AC460]|uniref:DUF4262 domain-containing protein n=1 Tax=Asticcacaulis sp. AC460 TaxID=1282360 RepID=UPI0003C40425|nr:DUF4262 domain-containing protein [Asticcacaulis sp. AC460]ESQ88729.1 hypothetical protein ABAC460_14865 [Asticcacaulis sp. AC460]
MRTALEAPDDALDTQEKDFVAKIREHGWSGTNIFAEGNQPGFTFTTGFWVTHRAPEIIVFGLKAEIAHSVFWDLYRDIANGQTLPLCSRSDELLGNHDAYLFPVHKTHYPEYLGWSRWFYAGDEFPCVQLVWPDRKNVFPWEETFDATMAAKQIDISESGWRGMSRRH